MDRANRAQMIGEKLKALRGEKTQQEVADAIGVTAMAISQYERGERVPNDEMKVRIADYFHKGVSEIFFAT